MKVQLVKTVGNIVWIHFTQLSVYYCTIMVIVVNLAPQNSNLKTLSRQGDKFQQLFIRRLHSTSQTA